MKKNKFLLLLVALFVLTAAIPAQAGTVSTQYLNTLTGDQHADGGIPTSGSYVRLARTANTALTVVDDGTGNNVYQYTGDPTATGAMSIHTYCNATENGYGDGFFTKSPLQKFTVRVNFSSTSGETHFFAMTKAWPVELCTDTSGVLIKNGGAYYYDVANGDYVSFIEDGTMSADTWYTVEAIFDLREAAIMMNASVYDADGYHVGGSDWQHVSNLGRLGNGANFTRTQIRFSGYQATDNVLIDDIAMYKLTLDDTAVTCTDFAVAQDYSSASLTFSDELEAGLITKDNVTLSCANPNFDVSDKYEVSYANGVVTLTLDSLPYSEDFTITVTTKVRPAGDIFGIPEAITKTFTTPEDPFKTALENLSFASSGNEVVATTTLDNSISTSRREYMFVVTSWNNSNECVAIRNLHGFVEGGQSPNITLPAVPFEGEGSRVYVSLLDNWYNLIPVGDARVFQLGGN